MVKHSVLLCCANVAAISPFRYFPCSAIRGGRAAAHLSAAVRLAGARANVARLGPGLRPGSTHLPGPRAMATRRHRWNAGVVALRSPHRRAFCRTRRPSPRARRLRSGPLAALLPRRRCTAASAPQLMVAGITSAAAGRVTVPVLRRHARSLALVRRAPPLQQRWRIRRASTLLLFTRHDRERGGHAEYGRVGRGVGSVWSYLHRHRRGAHTLRSPRSCALELASHSASGVVSGAGSRQPVFVGGAGAGDLAAHVLGGASPAAQRARYLDHRNRSRVCAVVCRLLFRAWVVLARNATRPLDELRTRRV